MKITKLIDGETFTISARKNKTQLIGGEHTTIRWLIRSSSGFAISLLSKDQVRRWINSYSTYESVLS